MDTLKDIVKELDEQVQTRKVHALDTGQIPTPEIERTVCGLPLTTDNILYSTEIARVTCLTCERLIGVGGAS